MFVFGSFRRAARAEKSWRASSPYFISDYQRLLDRLAYTIPGRGDLLSYFSEAESCAVFRTPSDEVVAKIRIQGSEWYNATKAKVAVLEGMEEKHKDLFVQALMPLQVSFVSFDEFALC